VIDGEAWLVVQADTVVFLPAGSTAASASIPLATVVGSEGLFVSEAGVAPSEAGFDLGAEVLNCTGLKTSYLVDHLSVFSYPGHETFLFLHWRHEGAVSSHLSCMLVSS
jgi:hypothetical protein